jgi:NAD dependent epimerase/dehydratase family enzyme
MSSELLNNARVLPRRLLAAGFQFEYPTIATALAAALHTAPVDVAPSRSGTRST